ncbi:MAG: hypothetical protein BV459_07630, partial [Thermoplasmata archaeon M11B2D]
TLEEDFLKSFSVYDLTELLVVFSLFKSPIFDFDVDDSFVVIREEDGRSNLRFNFCDPTFVDSPKKEIIMPDEKIKFVISADELAQTIRAASILQAPNIVFSSDGQDIFVEATDEKNSSVNNFKLKVADGNGDKYRIVLLAANFKMLPNTYNVSISSKPICRFESDDGSVRYYAALETTTTYGE